MPFQSTVNIELGQGVVGDVSFESPLRSTPYVLVSGDAANNVVGRAFTITSEGVAAAGGTGVFAGILANLKVYPLQGTVAGTLTPTLALPNNATGELVTMGDMYVSLPAAAAIGDRVTYNTTTGALSSVARIASFTGVIAVTTGVLTVSALAAGGYVGLGQELTGAGVPAGTRITAQLSGTAGQAGTYQTNITTAVSSTAMTVQNSPLASGAGFAFVPEAVVSKFTVTAAGLANITLTN